MKKSFRKIASQISNWVGSAATFMGALLIVLVWATTGPMFEFSDTWQLIINTGTTIVTFLMVFLIQNTQNRDGRAVQMKLDELIRATKGAHQYYIGLQDLSDEDIDILNDQLHEITKKPGVSRGLKNLHETVKKEDIRRG